MTNYLVCPICQAAVCECVVDEKNVPFVTAEQLKEQLEKWPDLLIINVTDQKTFDDCHIDGSINIPINQLTEYANDYDRVRKIVIYCTSHECRAALVAWKLLDDLGFERIFVFKGGTKEWKEKGFKINGPCKATYLKK